MAGLGETADLAVRLTLDSGKFTRGLGGAARSLGKFEQGIGRMGRGAGQLSTGLARAGSVIAVGVGAGLVGAAKAAIDFEDAFAGVKKTVDPKELEAAGLSFEDLEKSFRDMAKRIPIAATDLARLGETAGALGVAAGDIDEFVETTALLGVTTNLSADEAADAFGRIGTILNLTGDEYEELADSIVALGNAGASTEAEITEITKRFAAQANQAGLTKEEIVGLASVTASLGFAPERGGTALARVFANMGTNIALANDKGKAFSKLVGEPITKLQRKIDQGKGLDIFLDVLQEIKGLSPTQANRTLKALGVTNQSDRSIFISMADQLPEVNKQLKIANEATGALAKESAARFDTIASKLMVLKNNLIDVGITIGEGMLPAIGRATEKLVKFLQTPENVDELKKLGTDIGDAIDGIDWDEVLKGAKSLVGIMKSAFDWAKKLFDLFNSMPTELKGALVGGLAVNKLSGGLVGAGLGNILGGAVKSALATIPIFGKAFVQPVFVTNMVPGGLGGGAPIPGGGGIGAALKGIVTDFGVAVAGLGLTGVAGLTIAAIAPAALFGLTTAIIDATGKPIPVRDREGRQETAEARGLDPAKVPVARPSNLQEGWYKRHANLIGEVTNITTDPLHVVLPRVKGVGDRPSPGSPGEFKKNLDRIGFSKWLAAGNPVKVTNPPKPIKFPPALGGAPGAFRPPPATTTRPAVMPAGLRASEQKLDGIKTAVTTTSAAQKAELGNIKNAVATQGTNQRTATIAQTAVNVVGNVQAGVAAASAAFRDAATQGAIRVGASNTASATRGVSPPITAAVYAIGSQIAGAVWAARPIIQSTTVVQKYNVTQRGGGTSDSRTAAGTGNV